MFFSKTKLHTPDVNICIKGEQIEIVTELKYLGVLLDFNLNFKRHIKSCASPVATSKMTVRGPGSISLLYMDEKVPEMLRH